MVSGVLTRLSGRGGIGLAIVAVHAGLAYLLCQATPIVASIEQTPIVASIVEVAEPVPAAPPVPTPQLVQVEAPTLEPPLVRIADEPAPNAITVTRTQAAPPPPPARTPAATPPVVTNVAYLEPPVPKYPPESRRSGEEGLVILRVLINEQGRAARIEIQQSSGYARLDAAARAAVERARFRPYLENGVPRMAMAVIPVEFTWKSRSAGRHSRS